MALYRIKGHSPVVPPNAYNNAAGYAERASSISPTWNASAEGRLDIIWRISWQICSTTRWG